MACSESVSDAEDGEWVEEEHVVVMEICGLVDVDQLKSVKKCKLVGIETTTPVLQLDNNIFQGKFEDVLGTAVIFENVGGEVNYVCQTEKKLEMSRAFIKSKQQVRDYLQQDPGSIESDTSDHTQSADTQADDP